MTLLHRVIKFLVCSNDYLQAYQYKYFFNFLSSLVGNKKEWTFEVFSF